MKQLEIHSKIDLLFQGSPEGAKFEMAQQFVLDNQDSKNYFFSKADENWLDWLWSNGLLDKIKEPSVDPSQYSWSLPELSYLLRLTEEGKGIDKIVEIIQSVSISEGSFNPEVVDRFSRIVSELPAKAIATLAPKILEEQWPVLMARFNQFGFEYKKMLETLREADDWSSILILARVMLLIRPHRTKEDASYWRHKPFYFHDLSEAELFEILVDAPEDFREEALEIVLKSLSDVVLFGDEKLDDGERIFSIQETFLLWDINFFIIARDGVGKHSSSRESIRDLCLVVVRLLEKLFSNNCGNQSFAREIYSKYIDTLPDSRSMWRLRLFVLSLCPEVFRNEIKEQTFRMFQYEKYGEFVGSSYRMFLKKTFGVLSEDEKQDFVVQFIQLFSDEDKRTKKLIVSPMVSCIKDSLSEVQKSALLELVDGELGEYNPEQEEERTIRSGTISPRAPGSEDEWDVPAEQIIGRLKSDWSPKALHEKYKRENDDEDYFTPKNANGVGNRLEAEIQKRPQEFLQYASSFFDLENLSSHYTYSFLSAVRKLFSEKKEIVSDDLLQIIVLIESIQRSEAGGLLSKEEEREDGFWNAGWQSVVYMSAGILKDLIGSEGSQVLFNAKNTRQRLLDLIESFSLSANPSIEYEEEQYNPEGSYSPQDSFMVAINSVRGKAFEALVNFAFRDGNALKESGSTSKIAEDTKKLYKDWLERENTQAIRFLFGHYLATFFYRDKDWIKELLPILFSQDASQQDLFLATFEGFVSQNIYKELFDETYIKEVYERILSIPSEELTKRKYFREPDEGIAVHLALAFIYYPSFTLESSLLGVFWEKAEASDHQEFVSFIGRHCVSRELGEKINEEGIDVEKLKTFWDWALEKLEPKALAGFGFWISPKDPDVFLDNIWLSEHIATTLEKTEGEIEWDYGLMERLSFLADASVVNTLNILRAHLLGEKNKEGRWFYAMDKSMRETFEKLFAREETKEGIKNLISDLLVRYGQRAWPLKDILEE